MRLLTGIIAATAAVILLNLSPAFSQTNQIGASLGDAITDTNSMSMAQLAQMAFNDSIYIPFSAWDWRAYSLNGGEPWWVDCSALPCTDLVSASTNYTSYGVDIVPAWLTKNILSGETTLLSDWATDVVARIAAPNGYQPGQLSYQDGMVWRMWQQATNCPDCWDIEGAFPPPTVSLRTFLADISDYPTYESNLEVEAEAEAEAQAAFASSLTTGGRFTAMSEDDGGGMMMDGSTPCVITNEATPFQVVLVTPVTNGMEIVFESCSDHLYQVQAASDLSTDTVWAAQALMIGNDGSTAWTDTNSPAYDHRFYRVQRYAFWDDADGDGLANIDEFNIDTDINNPDTDGDGVLDGDDPNPLDPANGNYTGTSPIRIYDAYGIYTNGTNVYLQTTAITTNLSVTVSAMEYFDTIATSNGTGTAMSAAGGIFFNADHAVMAATLSPAYTNGQHHVYWIHALGTDSQWSPYVKVVVNPNVNDILNKIQTNYSAFQDLQFNISVTESTNGATRSTKTGLVRMKGPYKMRVDYSDGTIAITSANTNWWYNTGLGMGGSMISARNGDSSASANLESDFFWDIPLCKTRSVATIINSTNAANVAMELQPTASSFLPLQNPQIDYTKGMVTELDEQAGDEFSESQYLNPTEVAPGIWLHTTHRHTLQFDAGDVLIRQTTMTSIVANQGLSDSLFDIPAP